MYDRFTRRSRLGRGSIPREIRTTIYRRDGYTCQFCARRLRADELTIDHLIPLSIGGLDEMTNYVTCCRACNQLKGSMPLAEFADTIKLDVASLPVHGDPVVDNDALPRQIRLLRRRIFERVRTGELHASGRRAQKTIEKHYRRDFWATPEGKALEAEFPLLPGQVRVMIPEIQAIAKNEREFVLLVELAKSANTRNLIGSVVTQECDVENRLRRLGVKTNDQALKRRIEQAWRRFDEEVGRRGL